MGIIIYYIILKKIIFSVPILYYIIFYNVLDLWMVKIKNNNLCFNNIILVLLIEWYIIFRVDLVG